MPIYAYKCTDCGHQEEVLQKMTDAPLTDCANCGRPSMAKQVTAAGFQLKGSGWYVTDFRNKDSGGKPTKQDGTADGKTDGKSDGAAAVAGATDAKAAAPSPSAAPAAAPTGATGGPGSST
jgi:putative FmdB family regulatory protein